MWRFIYTVKDLLKKHLYDKYVTIINMNIDKILNESEKNIETDSPLDLISLSPESTIKLTILNGIYKELKKHNEIAYKTLQEMKDVNRYQRRRA